MAHIVDTTIVGMIRKGIISKTIRDRSHAVGLKLEPSHSEYEVGIGRKATNV